MHRWTVHVSGVPTTKIYFPAVVVGNTIYYFDGSHQNDGHQICVNLFNTVSLRWRRLPPVVTAGKGERPLEVPSRCSYHTAVLIEDIIYMWGGCAGQGTYCNVLYGFEVDAHRWSKPEVCGTVPEGRRKHSACVLGKDMYICGGYDLLDRYAYDLYKLDTTTMVWSLINTSGTVPPVSLWHSATIIGTKMFVFEGQTFGDYDYNNIRVFDTETSCWLVLPSAQLQPKEFYHSVVAYNRELYIVSQRPWLKMYPCDEDLFSDLWKFNPQTLSFSWKKLEPRGKGPCFRWYRPCCCMLGDRIFLFGGQRDTGTNFDELYILDINPSLKILCKLAVIQYNLEQLELPHNIRWELAAMTKNQQDHEK